MDISPAGISAFQHQQLMQQVDVKVAKASLDAARQQGDAAISLLEAATNIQAKSIKGATLDVTG